MAQLPVLKPKAILRALQRAGFYIHHQIGSHARLLHRTRSELRVTLPIHTKDVPLPTLKRILQQADLTPDEFRKYL